MWTHSQDNTVCKQMNNCFFSFTFSYCFVLCLNAIIVLILLSLSIDVKMRKLTRYTNNDKYACTYGGKYCCRVRNNYGCIHIINALKKDKKQNKWYQRGGERERETKEKKQRRSINVSFEMNKCFYLHNKPENKRNLNGLVFPFWRQPKVRIYDKEKPWKLVALQAK